MQRRCFLVFIIQKLRRSELNTIYLNKLPTKIAICELPKILERSKVSQIEGFDVH